MITAEQIAAAARKVAEDAREKTHWNYDTVEVSALAAVADAFSALADQLDESLPTDEFRP